MGGDDLGVQVGPDGDVVSDELRVHDLALLVNCMDSVETRSQPTIVDRAATWALWLAVVGLAVDVIFALIFVLSPPYIPSPQIPEPDPMEDLFSTILILVWLLCEFVGPALGLGALIRAESSAAPIQVRKKALLSLGFSLLQAIAFCAFIKFVANE